MRARACVNRLTLVKFARAAANGIHALDDGWMRQRRCLTLPTSNRSYSGSHLNRLLKQRTLCSVRTIVSTSVFTGMITGVTGCFMARRFCSQNIDFCERYGDELDIFDFRTIRRNVFPDVAHYITPFRRNLNTSGQGGARQTKE